MSITGESDKIFETIRKFKHLDVIERLELIPQSEMATLKAITKLSANGTCGVSDIAKYLNVSLPAVSRTLKRLREKGYIRCVEGENDRRGTCVKITDEGKDALNANLRKMTGFMKQAFSHLEKEELEGFFFLFEKVYNGMKEELDKLPKGNTGKG